MAGAAAGLERALVASLALHGAVLAGVAIPGSVLRQDAAPHEPITARLVEAVQVELPKEKPAPAYPVLERAAALKPAEKKIAALKNPETVILEAKIPPVPAPVAVVPHEAVPAPEPQPVVMASAPAEPSAVGQYRSQLLGAAGRFKRYPETARENNWAGDVVVRVTVGAKGAAAGLPEIGLRRSSGHAVLDQQALEMFRQAARAVPVPQPLRGREFSLEVRAVYGLED